jgi:hypothetical protein
MPDPLDDNRDGLTLSGASDTLPKYIIGTPPTIESLRKRRDDAASDPNGRRIRSKLSRAYFDGKGQLSSKVLEVLELRKQPQIYTNRIRPAVNGVLGVLENARSDPQAYPRNPGDQDSADVVTKVLRFVADQSDFGDIKQDVAENFLIEGTGACIIEMDGEDIVPTQIRWEEFYCDRYARRNDRKDARFMGIAKWVDVDTVNKNPRWKDAIEEYGNIMQPASTGAWSSDFEDRGDQGLGWINTRRRRVLLCEEYAIEQGEWKRIVYIGACVLEYAPSPYLDEKKRPYNPIEVTACYVDENNDAYGIVDDMMPLQDEINASRSRSLHLMNSRQVQNSDPTAPPVDSEVVRDEAAKADGVMPFGWSIIPTQDMTQANMLRNQEAKGEIERMGPTPAVLGRQEGAGQSGRARLVSQQAGLTELARPLARLSNWELRVYRQIWMRAKQFKTDPWFIRVTDDVRAPEFLTVNEPVKLSVVVKEALSGDAKASQAIEAVMPGVIKAFADGDAMAAQAIQQAVTIGGDPTIMVKNHLAQLDVDIILDTVADTATLAQEVWAELVQLVGQAGGLQVVYTPAFELMIEASPLADKTRVIELIKKGREEQENNQVQQLTQTVQQLQQQLEQMNNALGEKQAVSTAVEAAKIDETHARTANLASKTRAQDVDTERSVLGVMSGHDIPEPPAQDAA